MKYKIIGRERINTSLHLRGKKRHGVVEDGHLDTERDEGKYQGICPVCGRRKDGVTSCNMKNKKFEE
jgi:hypothetical protein